jgi:hypothetical protein
VGKGLAPWAERLWHRVVGKGLAPWVEHPLWPSPRAARQDRLRTHPCRSLQRVHRATAGPPRPPRAARYPSLRDAPHKWKRAPSSPAVLASVKAGVAAKLHRWGAAAVRGFLLPTRDREPWLAEVVWAPDTPQQEDRVVVVVGEVEEVLAWAVSPRDEGSLFLFPTGGKA